MSFVPGLELCRRLHADGVAPVLARRFPGLPYAAARVDSGSELFGFDTERSTDHDWGPRLQLFVEDPATAAAVRAALDADLPATVQGWPTRFRSLDGLRLGVPDAAGPRHGVTVESLGDFLRRQLGADPRAGWSDGDWLATPTQRLAELTAGAVYADLTGELSAVRARLSWYPGPLWRGVVAAQWARVAQEEAFVGRCGEVGDELGSALAAARIVRDLMRLCLLLGRRYPPYAKWLGSAFARLPEPGELPAALASVLAATGWRQREAALARAYPLVAARSNAAGLHDPVDPRVRPFHDRPFLVLGADRFVAALGGQRPAVDQIVDNTDVLGDPARTRQLYPNDR